ncbi:LysR family transcriptional regulator [Yoonia sp. I 8.24]|uniref:LysR family transcriptional regulator n=1 Tax=Yoonia sp. I 8.24 TaxID=1537229 RepID=UPI001EDFA606|nr:LysR family transcriptional regulator [Yoonia sp. I 8.24]MCG3267888.1 LysR family transcriptional regulator [Yoonia sp. I 8.24]
MNWDDLKIVLAIARNGTQSAAASVLTVDQSTIARRLTAIETSLNVALFVRSKSGFMPTQAGEQVIQRAAAVETHIQWLEDEAQSAEKDLHGPVTIVGNHWTLSQIIRSGVVDLLSKNQGLELRFVASSNHWSLTQGHPEIALWFEIDPKDGEFAAPVGQVPYATYVREDLNPDTAQWVSFMDPRAQRAPNRWLAKLQSPRADVRLTGNDAGLVLAAIQSGVGKGLLPCCIAEHMPNLKRITSTFPPLIRCLHVHANTGTVKTRRIQQVITMLRDTIPTAFADPTSNLIK